MKIAFRGLTKNLLLLTIFFIFATGCASRIKIKQDPFYDSFYEKTSLIMTKEEKGVYKHLPDKESKEEFIQEFWRIRDPDPATEENEAKTEFEARVDYANKWFATWEADIGKDIQRDKHWGGWNSERGRIYIVLGPPDMVILDGMDLRFDQSRERMKARESVHEEWYYDRFRLWLSFSIAQGGNWVLDSVPFELVDALETSKLNWVSSAYQIDVRKVFKFKAEFKDDRIIIRIPTSRISLEEKDEKLNMELLIKIGVYHNHKKIDEIEETKSLGESQEELLKKREILFEIPYKPTLRGQYYFDVVVQDLMSMAVSKYRNFAKYKLKK